MKIIVFFLLLFLSFPTWAEGPDFSHRYGVSLAGGWSYPVTGNEFDQRADGNLVAGFYLRYQVSRDSGLQFGYTRFEWTNSPTAARIYDLVYMYRLAPKNWFTPFIGGGVGLVDIANYNLDENLNLGLKARIGGEYLLNENMVLDFVLDFQYVGKMPGEDNDLQGVEMYALAPQLILSYFFK